MEARQLNKTVSIGLTMNVVLLMGAGFAKAAGSPLADELFDQIPIGGSHERDSQVNLVQSQWYEWQKTHPVDGAEAFITHVYRNSAMISGTGVIWRALQTYLALRISAAFVRWSFVDGRANRSSDNFMNAYVGPSHERWWDTLFRYHKYDQPLTVLTTNWDIWIERALRPVPRPRRRRPGFHYGQGPERLAAAPRFPSRWYVGTDFGKDTTIHGHVTLLKLHGSLSWAVTGNLLEKYGDCRPAFRGDAAIIPPIEQKEFGSWLCPIWKQAQQSLEQADRLLVVGYSFPDYDQEIRRLLKRGINDRRIDVHIFDPSAGVVAKRIGSFLPQTSLIEHGAIPDACDDLRDVIGEQERC
jgi:hypothetical protein